jgi:pyruvate dehydrogenase E1 component
MPEFWEFPTVSMGLGPIMAIYQARFNRYLEDRGIVAGHAVRAVWAFLGDGEMDEPETSGRSRWPRASNSTTSSS